MERKEKEPVEIRMQALLREMDYDFGQFTLEGFAHWLEERRGRQIIFVPYHFERLDVSGAWLADEVHDYIFYETEDAPAVLQVHSQLHEMSHILAGHTTAEVDPEQLALLFEQVDGFPEADRESLLLRSAQTDGAEMEAEILASLIQERVLRNSRLEELTRVVSSDFAEHFSRYIDLFEAKYTAHGH
jgi:hypothetical protein